MRKDNGFKVLNAMPQSIGRPGMHPETKKIIEQLKKTKGKVLAYKCKSPREAKNRMDALRRAKARGKASYREARRKGSAVYFRVR